MSRTTRNWLLAAAVLFLVGSLILGGVFMMVQWDFSKLGTTQYVTNSYDITEEFANITIISKTVDVILQPSADEKTTVTCRDRENAQHRISVKNGSLEINLEDRQKWYENVGVNVGKPCITLSVPQGRYGSLQIQATSGDVTLVEGFSFERMAITVSTGDLSSSAAAETMKLKTTTGDITLQNFFAGALELSVNTGDVKLEDVRCASLQAEGRTGDMKLRNVIATERMSLSVTTGDVRFDGCDGAQMKTTATTGSITGSLLSPKIFFANSNTGSVDVPRTTTGGTCELTTNTGSIRITITE